MKERYGIMRKEKEREGMRDISQVLKRMKKERKRKGEREKELKED